MRKIILHERVILVIGLVGILLAGSDAEAGVFPINVLAGAVLLGVAGLMALARRSE